VHQRKLEVDDFAGIFRDPRAALEWGGVNDAVLGGE